MQRGRRRAPFARSRDTYIHIKGTLWRTERVHRPGIYHLNTCLMAGALRLPALRQWWFSFTGGCATLTCPTLTAAFVCWRVRCAYPPYTNHSPLNIGGGRRKRRVSHVRYISPSAAQISPIVSELFSRFSHSTATVSAPPSGRIR